VTENLRTEQWAVLALRRNDSLRDRSSAACDRTSGGTTMQGKVRRSSQPCGPWWSYEGRGGRRSGPALHALLLSCLPGWPQEATLEPFPSRLRTLNPAILEAIA